MAVHAVRGGSSIESDAFKEVYGDVFDIISDPTRLAWKLSGKNLITKADRDKALMETVPVDQRVSILMRAIEVQISQRPDTFSVFMSILRDEESLALLYSKLKDAFRK